MNAGFFSINSINKSLEPPKSLILSTTIEAETKKSGIEFMEKSTAGDPKWWALEKVTGPFLKMAILGINSLDFWGVPPLFWKTAVFFYKHISMEFEVSIFPNPFGTENLWQNLRSPQRSSSLWKPQWKTGSSVSVFLAQQEIGKDHILVCLATW